MTFGSTGPASMTRPFSAFEWLIAARYLRARRREGFISVIAGFSFLGIMLGVATLIVVLSVMGGFRKELLDKIIGVNGHAFIQPIEMPLNDYAAVADRVARAKGVTAAVPIVEGQAFATMPGRGGGVLVRGIREADLKATRHIANAIRAGSLDGFDATPAQDRGVVIGVRLANSLGLSQGDRLTLLAPDGPPTPFGSTPRRKSYVIHAVFEVGMSEFDSSFIFMPLDEAQAYFNKEGDVSAIEIFVENPDRMDDYRAGIEQAMGRPALLTDWRQRNRTFFGALEVERNVMFMILTLIVLVAALNIISGLIMLVKDKSADIAILRTMGAAKGAVMRIFLITGGAIGVLGNLAGLLLGLVLTWNVEEVRQFISQFTRSPLFPPELYFLSRLPAIIDTREVMTVLAVSLSLSLLATLYPSWKASKTDPVEALRYG
jgi:lipoprotein-releasing system permease protein